MKNPFYEMLYDMPPTYLNVKVFISLSYVSTLESNRTKLHSRSKNYIFLGYNNGFKTYVVLDINNREIFVKMLFFYENIFPYKNIKKKLS